VAGFTGPPSNPLWLYPDEAQPLLRQVEPVGDVVPALKQMELAELIESLNKLEEELEAIAQMRGQALAQSHRRVRSITKEGQVKVKPQLPMDILGIFVLQPGQRRDVA